MVLLAAIVEYRHLALQQRGVEETESLTSGLARHAWSKKWKRSGLIAHLTVIFGTIVWGYGDVVLTCLVAR